MQSRLGSEVKSNSRYKVTAGAEGAPLAPLSLISPLLLPKHHIQNTNCSIIEMLLRISIHYRLCANVVDLN
jgi:hypothetical protein